MENEYKLIAQDKYGCIAEYHIHPKRDNVQWLVGYPNIIQKTTRTETKGWGESIINLETHGYKIKGGILIKVEKEKIFKGSELQCKHKDRGSRIDCPDYAEYRIKPKTKTVRFQNYINQYGDVRVKGENEPIPPGCKWLGECQEVTIDEI